MDGSFLDMSWHACINHLGKQFVFGVRTNVYCSFNFNSRTSYYYRYLNFMPIFSIDENCRQTGDEIWGFAHLVCLFTVHRVSCDMRLTALWPQYLHEGRLYCIAGRGRATVTAATVSAMKMKAFTTSQTGSTQTVFDSATNGSSRASDQWPGTSCWRGDSRWRMRWRNEDASTEWR